MPGILELVLTPFLGRPGMRFFFQRDSARIGFRGRAILLVALTWLLIGLDILVEVGNNDHRSILIYGAWPFWAHAALWMGSAVSATAFARTPPTWDVDKYAFMSLIVPPALICGFSAWSAFVQEVLLHHGMAAGHSGLETLIWGLVVAVVLHFSSWPEPSGGNDQ